MKARTLAIVGVVCALGATGPVAARAQGYDPIYDDGYYGRYDDDWDVDAADVVDFFRAALDPYGTWFRYGTYGWVWRPRGVASGWRPYRDGHWVLTDAGWTWVADEPWGWGPYHYGRWFHDARHGWVWVPGREWAPSWVAWRRGNGWVGWAPLPPQAVWGAGGIAGDVWIEPRYYNFVEERYLVEPRVRTYCVPYDRVRRHWGGMRNVTHYGRSGRRIWARPFEDRDVEKWVGRPVKRQRVTDVDRAVPDRFRKRDVERDVRGRDGRDRPNEKGDRDRAERERRDRERVDRERSERERQEAERARQDRARMDRERQDQERRDRDRGLRERDRTVRGQADRDRAAEREQDRAVQERTDRRDRAAQDRLDRDRARDQQEEARRQQREQDRAAAERARQERADRSRAEREQANQARRQQAEQERAQRDQQRQQERAQRDQAQQQRRQQIDQERAQREQHRQQDRAQRQHVQQQRRVERGTLTRMPPPQAQRPERAARGGKRD